MQMQATLGAARFRFNGELSVRMGIGLIYVL